MKPLICSRCGHENPEDLLFCEECDWRLDIKYVPEKKRNPMTFAAVTALLGVIAVVCTFASISDLAAIIIGGLAVVVGGYSTGVSRHMSAETGKMGLIVSGLGLVLGVIGFLIGFTNFVGTF